jgi:hypothetical protein
MRWIARVLLVWLVVLALPVQGLAAATLMHCMPAHDGHHAEHADHAAASGTASASASASVLSPGAAEGEAHVHAHDHPAQAADAEAGAPPGGEHACSVCAACCLALALPATVARLPALPIDPTFWPEAAPALPSFVPAGLDRPPRSLRA